MSISYRAAFALIASTTIALIAPPAFAAAAEATPGVEPVALSIDSAQYDLSRQADRAALNHQVELAANQVCASWRELSDPLAAATGYRQCHRAALTQAQHDIALAEQHQKAQRALARR